jgi:hypothetical protein
MAKRVTLIDRAIAKLEGEITARQHALAVLRDLQAEPPRETATEAEAAFVAATEAEAEFEVTSVLR